MKYKINVFILRRMTTFLSSMCRLRIRMPTQEQCAETFTSKNKMSYGRALEGVRPQKQKGPQTTVELMAGSGLKYVHATHKGRQGLDGDLERSRKQVFHFPTDVVRFDYSLAFLVVVGKGHCA